MDVPYPLYEELYRFVFESAEEKGHFDPDMVQKTAAEIAAKYQVSPAVLAKTNDSGRNTSTADYVWLPLRFIEPCEKYPNGYVTDRVEGRMAH